MVTKTEMNERVYEVYRLLLDHRDRAQIQKFAALKWGISRRQTNEYIHRAQQDLLQLQQETKAEAYAKQMRSLDDLYCQSYKRKDFRTCLNIIKEQNELAGLHTGHMEHTINNTPDEIKALREHIDAAVCKDPANRYKVIEALKEQRRLSGGDPEDPDEEPAECCLQQ